jgi:hypothetical protein
MDEDKAVTPVRRHDRKVLFLRDPLTSHAVIRAPKRTRTDNPFLRSDAPKMFPRRSNRSFKPSILKKTDFGRRLGRDGPRVLLTPSGPLRYKSSFTKTTCLPESILVEREYDVFEQLPDGAPLWRGHASGLLNVRIKLEELARTTSNECFAMYIPTREIVARIGGARQVLEQRIRKFLVFQVSYDSVLSIRRAKVLREHGYEAASVLGNEAAKVVLSTRLTRCDFFIIGHSAPESTRREMVVWLREHYPNVGILALNSPGILELDGADYNVKLNGPETWLPLVSTALSPPDHISP